MAIHQAELTFEPLRKLDLETFGWTHKEEE